MIDRFEGGGDNGALNKVVLENTEGGEDRELEIDGAFIAIGHKPNSDIVIGQVDTDDDGYVEVEGRSTRTKLAGVFAAGDLVDHTYRQAVTAAGSGCAAALDAEAYLRDRPIDAEAHWEGDPDKMVAARGEGSQLTEVWTNWARQQRCAPVRIERPGSEEELARAVTRAAGEGLEVRVAGSGHSFTDTACTDGVLIDIGAMDRVLDADPSSGLVTVQAGITLHELGARLAELGLAMENQGDIDAQTLAGAISTATHGTGATYRNISSQVEAVRLVTASGDVLDIGAGEPDLLGAARVGLGALGALSAVTLRTVPIFTLERRDAPDAAGPGAGRLRRPRRRRRPLRAVRVPVHGRGAHAHVHAQRPRARAGQRAGRGGAGAAGRERRAGGAWRGHRPASRARSRS